MNVPHNSAAVYEVNSMVALTTEGRIAQIEYATEAVARTGTCIGIMATDGIVIVAECRNKSEKHNLRRYKEKIFDLQPNLLCAIAGLAGDANAVTSDLQNLAANYLVDNLEVIHCKQIVERACFLKTSNFERGNRPYALDILYMGWNARDGFQLMTSDVSGTASAWRMTAIGCNASYAKKLLLDKLESKEDFVLLDEARYVALGVLAKTMDVKQLNGMQVEMATLQLVRGDCQCKNYSYNEIREFLEVFNKEYAKE